MKIPSERPDFATISDLVIQKPELIVRQEVAMTHRSVLLAALGAGLILSASAAPALADWGRGPGWGGHGWHGGGWRGGWHRGYYRGYAPYYGPRAYYAPPPVYYAPPYYPQPYYAPGVSLNFRIP